jgi:hypothetical protein
MLKQLQPIEFLVCRLMCRDLPQAMWTVLEVLLKCNSRWLIKAGSKIGMDEWFGWAGHGMMV